MQNNYTETIPFELGVKLKEAGYWNPGCTYDSSYNGPCYFVIILHTVLLFLVSSPW